MTGAHTIGEFISEYSFGTLVSSDLSGTHLPFIFEPGEGDFGCLYGHFARSNPHWETLENQRVMVIFNGPHAYVSPAWYKSKPAVPTWNYAAIHCYGVVTLLNDEENARAMNQLVAKYEPELLDTQELMPSEYQERLRKGVVGFKILVDDIHAKEKLGQHRKSDDQEGVFAALRESTHPDAVALSSYMQKRKLGLGR